MKKESSFETFCEWLDECCQEAGLGLMLLGDNYILSWDGSDGPDIIGEEMIGDEVTVSFSNPVAVDNYLQEDGYYEDECEPGAPFYGHRRAPKIHYLDWFNKKYNI